MTETFIEVLSHAYFSLAIPFNTLRALDGQIGHVSIDLSFVKCIQGVTGPPYVEH